MPKIYALTLIVALMLITSCGDEKKPAPVTTPVPTSGDLAPTPPVTKCNVITDSCDLVIKGTYADAFNTTHTVSVSSWVSSHATYGSSTYNLIILDNTEKRLIAQNSSSNGFAPSKYSAFDWTFVGSQLYYCQVAYDKDTQADAESALKADASNPASAGCGGFPWSALN